MYTILHVLYLLNNTKKIIYFSG